MEGGLTLKEKLTYGKDQWHNWHRPDEASENEVAAVAQWQDLEHIQSPSVSVKAVEPHHANMMLLKAPSRRGPL